MAQTPYTPGGGYTPPTYPPKPPGYSGAWPPSGAASPTAGAIGALAGINVGTQYGTPPAPPSGGGGYTPPAVQTGPYGNWFDPTDGPNGNWKDAWGNVIAHMNVTPGAGGPGTPAGFPTNAPTTPTTPTVPGVPTPPGQTPQTFYAPTTGSPYLQLGGNFLSYLSNQERNNLDSVLRAAGFQSTGAMNTYGPSDYVRPPQFDQNDVNQLALSEPMRQWLRFYLGYFGYGNSYQLPAGYVPGSGLPTPPPWPQAPTPPGPAPVPDPYHP